MTDQLQYFVNLVWSLFIFYFVVKYFVHFMRLMQKRYLLANFYINFNMQAAYFEYTCKFFLSVNMWAEIHLPTKITLWSRKSVQAGFWKRLIQKKWKNGRFFRIPISEKKLLIWLTHLVRIWFWSFSDLGFFCI